MNIKIILAVLIAAISSSVLSQTDINTETKFNQSSYRQVSGNENNYASFNINDGIPSELLARYNSAVDSKNDMQKQIYGKQIEQYLQKSNPPAAGDIKFISESNFQQDWYSSDIQITSSQVAYSGGYRQMELKQGEDGWLYMAVNLRNVNGNNGYISVYRSSNGGINWSFVNGIYSVTSYFGSVAMLVESRNNSVPDSTRILLYTTASSSTDFSNAVIYSGSFRRDGSGYFLNGVDTPPAGSRFVNISACSDGMFYSSGTYMHVVVREETNTGSFVSLRHYRSIDWGANYTYGSIQTFNNDTYPVCGYSNETGTDSIYIAVERVIQPTEHEIRLITVSDIPNNSYQVRYITDAAPGTIYQRPALAIQQRSSNLPQRILVTSTKNNRAVYHYSNDGGASWNIDLSLGLSSQSVDYTSCSADTTEAGGKDFIASFVDTDGDSVTVRNGDLGSMGAYLHKRNSVQSTGVLAPVCAVYKNNGIKYAAFGYAGIGPANIYFNMENLVTGINQTSNELPSAFSLEQNYPNPFNPVTNIKFSVPKNGLVKLAVYDITGREVAKLVDQSLTPGSYTYGFDASGLSSGIYLYSLTASEFSSVKKMILIK